MVASGQVKSFGPIQPFMCSGFDHRANTTDAGALKVRTISSSLSATLFLRAPITFSFVELLEVGGHPVEALLPETSIDRQPVVDGHEAFGFEPARSPLGGASARDQSGALQDFEMARHRGQADLKRFCQLVDRRFT